MTGFIAVIGFSAVAYRAREVTQKVCSHIYTPTPTHWKLAVAINQELYVFVPVLQGCLDKRSFCACLDRSKVYLPGYIPPKASRLPLLTVCCAATPCSVPEPNF